MTLAPQRPAGGEPARPDLVTLTIDGFEVAVPTGTLLIRAAEEVGIQVPRFCDHPLLDPIGACRQCLVEVEGQRKPVASCTVAVTEGMVVGTHLTSELARTAQAGNLELLLINHPLDCPICDKGGECPLQNQTMSNGDAESRFHDVKRTYAKPLAISSQVLLDRERCVLCARCTRFSMQIAGDPFIELYERGALEQVAIDPATPFRSYFSGNTVQICPVGALTAASYRFRARPFDLVSAPTICEHCASGCAIRADHRRGQVVRRLAGDDPQVNEEWICDKGRWAFAYARQPERLTTPLVRNADGELVAASWPAALERAAAGLTAARGRAAVLTGGRLTLEDAYAYAKFTRVALRVDSIDFRARPHSAEEADFLVSRIAGRGIEVSYDDLLTAPEVVLVGLEPEEESPILFLRLRRGFRSHGLRVRAVAAFTSPGLRKCGAELVATLPGGEAEALAHLELADGAVILLGERLASSPGSYAAAVDAVARCGGRLAWVPRRAGERGALEAGCLPGVLPGGRWLADAAHREQVEALWGVALPPAAGHALGAALAEATAGSLDALLVAGLDPDDLADPAAARAALAAVGFLVSVEVSHSAVTELADVVLPVAPVAEKAGTFLDWEGRPRPFPVTLTSTAMSDLRVLHTLAGEMGIALGLPDVPSVRAELAALGAAAPSTRGRPAPAAPGTRSARSPFGTLPALCPGEAVLATHHQLLDLGVLQAGAPTLTGTARPAFARLSPASAAALGIAPGEFVTVRHGGGEVTLPLELADLPDAVVWLPTNSPASRVRADLGAAPGTVVALTKGGS